VQIVIAGAGVALAAGVVLYRASLEGGLRAVIAARGLGDGYLDPFGNGPSFIVWILLPTVMYTLIGRSGALASLLAGSVVALAGLTTGFDVGGVPAEVYSALVSAVVFVAVSLVTGRPRRGQPSAP